MKIHSKNRKFLVFLLAGWGLLVGCGEKEKIGLANPASMYCVKKRGTVHIKKRGDGGEYGVCVFADHKQCEEWALFRGECPLSGVEITDYLTSEGIYCALKGGQVLENELLCQLPLGIRCPTQDLYQGTCPSP